MPNHPRNERPKQRASTAARKDAPKPSQKEEEVLREQSKTETEERPYLDTVGGE